MTRCPCLLKTFCCCGSLRTGTLVGGVAAIILAILGIIMIFTAHVDLKTLVFDWLPKWIVNIIVVVNLVMTIIISCLLIAGVFKRNMYLMIPWIVLGALLPIGILISVIVTSVSFFNDDKDLQGGMFLGFGLLSLVVYIYMWLVAFSFFYIIREETLRGAYSKDPFRRLAT